MEKQKEGKGSDVKEILERVDSTLQKLQQFQEKLKDAIKPPK